MVNISWDKTNEKQPNCIKISTWIQDGIKSIVKVNKFL